MEETINKEVTAEQEGVGRTTPSIPEPSIEDMAAHDYRMLIPEFYRHVDFFSKKKLLNILKALVEYPLEQDQPKLSYDDEKKAFYLGMQIFDCKFILMKAVMELTKNKENLAKFTEELAKTKSKEGETK